MSNSAPSFLSDPCWDPQTSLFHSEIPSPVFFCCCLRLPHTARHSVLMCRGAGTFLPVSATLRLLITSAEQPLWTRQILSGGQGLKLVLFPSYVN